MQHIRSLHGPCHCSSGIQELSNADKVKMITKDVKERFILSICVEHAMRDGILAQSWVRDLLTIVADNYCYDLQGVDMVKLIRPVHNYILIL